MLSDIFLFEYTSNQYTILGIKIAKETNLSRQEVSEDCFKRRVEFLRFRSNCESRSVRYFAHLISHVPRVDVM